VKRRIRKGAMFEGREDSVSTKRDPGRTEIENAGRCPGEQTGGK